tara:strand:+ start:134 stop:523 length:390 start_codon:yes stop_codon:yes gene_type:complete
MKSVRVSRDAPHRVHGDGAADHSILFTTRPVGPFNFEHYFFVEGSLRKLCRYASYMVCWHAGPQGGGLRPVGRIHVTVGHELERWNGFTPVLKRKFTYNFRGYAGEPCIGYLPGIVVPAERLAIWSPGE